jgi:DNA-binding CsgD family transcriptional regulator
METLSIDDIQKLNQGIQQLYTIHNFDTFGVDTLAIVDRLVPSQIPVFQKTNTRTGQVYPTFLPNDAGCMCNKLKMVLEEVLSDGQLNHPIAEHMPETLSGAYKISDFVNRKELHTHEKLYQQFLRQLDTEDQMSLFIPDINPARWCELAKLDTMVIGFLLNRPSLSFTERDRSMLNLFQPHLLQAYNNARCYQQVQQNLDLIQQSFDRLAIAIVDLDGRIKSITPQAIAWLNDYFTKSTHSFQLPEILRSWMNHQVKLFTANSDLIETCLPLRIQQGERELTIRLVIEEPGVRYMLIFQEQTRSLANFVELLGLTQREVDVLLCIMQGNDNKSIASILDISISTVRKHLENIYRKLNVQSRTAAISRVLEQIGFLPSSPIG